MSLNVQLAARLTLHPKFSETKIHALKSSYIFYTLDLPFRMNYGSFNFVFRNSCPSLVSYRIDPKVICFRETNSRTNAIYWKTLRTFVPTQYKKRQKIYLPYKSSDVKKMR